MLGPRFAPALVVVVGFLLVVVGFLLVVVVGFLLVVVVGFLLVVVVGFLLVVVVVGFLLKPSKQKNPTPPTIKENLIISDSFLHCIV